MEKVLILVDNRANRRLLTELLSGEFRTGSGEDPPIPDSPFDAAILDAPSLERLKEQIVRRREAERPVFLPFLLLVSRPDIGYATRQLWKTCDEIVLTPIEKIELRARLGILLRAREFSRELEKRYYALARSAPIGVFLLKGDHVAWVNPFIEKLLGRSAEVLMNMPWEEWFVHEDRAALRRAEAGEEGGLVAGKIVRFATNAGIRWAEVRVTPVGVSERQGFLGVMTDVTGEREIARIKEEFLATVSHELRTPLTGILGYSELLLQQLPAEKEAHEFVQYIHRHAEHLSQMVGDLLNLSQLRAGLALAMEKTSFDLREALNALMHQFQQSHPDREFLMHAPRAVPVRADRSLILQALTNVIRNAIQFSRGETPVEIHVRTEGSSVRIEIVDHGIGMTPEEAVLAWDIFYRVDASMTAGGGFGLGLPVARAILEEHGGSLAIASSPGQGTRVSLILPGMRNGEDDTPSRRQRIRKRG